jgi:hypothetical protein
MAKINRKVTLVSRPIGFPQLSDFQLTESPVPPPKAWAAMWRRVRAGTMLGLLLALGAAACDKGPMQRTGEKIDRATGQDKVIGTGPLEQAGRNVDQAVKDLKKID